MTPEERKAIRLEQKKKNQEKFKLAKAEGKSLDTARSPIGNQVGDRQRMAEFKEMLLSPVTGTAVIRKVIDIARNDEHPGQMAALKMCIDRMLPTSLFEEKKDGSRTAINITISGVNESVVEGETIDG